MKIVIVNQPMDMLVKPHQNSIGIWTYKVAQHAAADHQVTVVGKRSAIQHEMTEQSRVSYRFVPPFLPNRKIIRYLDRIHKDRLPSYASVASYLDYAVQAALIARRERADIVHIHNFSQFVPVIRALYPNAKIVLHMHCEWLTQLDRDVIESRLRKTDLVIGSSDYITEQAAAAFSHLGDRFATVYNGVDILRFRADSGSERDSHGRHESRRLLFVGRVSPEKGVHDLIRALILIARQIPTVSLEIVGPMESLPREFIVDVAADPAIQQLAEFYEPGADYVAYLRALVPPELATQVTFRGAVTQDDLVDIYKRADVVVNPSYSESFGMSLVEALSCGTAVVATRVGGMPGIVGEDESVGLLVDRGDVTGICDAVLRLLGDDSYRESAGQRGRLLVTDQFSWDQVARSVVERYEQLAHGDVS